MRFRFAILFIISLATSGLSGVTHAADPPIVIDNFDSTMDWAAFPADGVRLDLSQDAGLHGKALRMDVGFTGGGYAVARRNVDLTLPENYAFTFQLRGDVPVNHLEMKFLDATGENVWWYVRRDMTFPREWQGFSTKKRQITFAWGPAPEELKHVAAIEIVVTAGSGGTGSVWIDDLELKELPSPGAAPPNPGATASSAAGAHVPGLAIDGDSTTTWQPAADDALVELLIDFVELREFGGLTIDWLPERHAVNYRLAASDDKQSWRELAEVRGSNGTRDYFMLPESECRYLRLRPFQVGKTPARPPIALAEITLKPLDFGATREAFFGAIAREAPRGSYPRSMIGEPSYWTVVGPDNSADDLLFSADGMIETGKQRASIEPFLEVNGRLISWVDATITQGQVDGLPIPRVTWTAAGLQLTITPFDHGTDQVCVRYLLNNMTAEPIDATLHLAVRPFQVNPPAQFLNFNGGTTRVPRLGQFHATKAALVGEAPESTPRFLLVGDRIVNVEPSTSSVVSFHQGDIIADWLWHGRRPTVTAHRDSMEALSGVLSYQFNALAPGATEEIDLAILLESGGQDRDRLPGLGSEPAPDSTAEHTFAAYQDSSLARWQSRIGPIGLSLPPAAQPLLESLTAQIGYILINRAGPAIQPGTRAYARSWIRDGSLTSSAMLRLGYNDVVKEFIEWYAPHQYANGKIPCVVDWRGADPVPEHDSSGEFIFLVAEYLRYSGDKALANDMWPRVQAAAAYLDSLRQERRTDEYRQPDKIEFFGLLPPSISHEGYSAKPMHSYWDDSFAYKGFTDAAWLAGELGHPQEARRWTEVAREFGADLAASVAATQKRHGIEYVPGCADLGDYDATSTTTFLSPTGAAALLPPAAIEATFEGYYKFFADRRDGAPWEAYTPYEVRNIGAFVHLGWRDRAQELATWFLRYQKPVGWRQWPEVVWNDESKQKFLGDLPHTWVGSDFVRSVLDMLLYVREDGRALVIGAGVPSAWLDDSNGVSVDQMPTPWGPLTYRMWKDVTSVGEVKIAITGMDRMPPEGIIVRLPNAAEVVVTKLPTAITIPASP